MPVYVIRVLDYQIEGNEISETRVYLVFSHFTFIFDIILSKTGNLEADHLLRDNQAKINVSQYYGNNKRVSLVLENKQHPQMNCQSIT